jgi:hypothetical protein
MGRGRAKAKQTKVARQLKYSGGMTDLDRLRSELGVNEPQRSGAEDHDLDERYTPWADQDEDEDDEDEDGEDESSYGPHGSNGNSRPRAS